MEYFSDVENGKQPQNVEEISHSVWCALVSKIERHFIFEEEVSYSKEPNHFSVAAILYNKLHYKKVTNKNKLVHFMNELKGDIPLAPNPLGNDDIPERAAVMDIIQYFYEYTNYDKNILREINRLFERNGLTFKLLENGNIERLLNPVLSETIKRPPFNSGDVELNQYLDKAVKKFLHHDFNTHRESLEALWDAFERIKTIPAGKKAVELVNKSSNCEKMRERIDKEAKELTEIGNNFMIRHTETNKTPITEEKHVDYLFHRMFALLWLWLQSLETDTNIKNVQASSRPSW